MDIEVSENIRECPSVRRVVSVVNTMDSLYRKWLLMQYVTSTDNYV